MIAEADIREALRACYATAPGCAQQLNIVDLGMVESIELAVDREAPGANIPGVPVKHRLTVELVAVMPEEEAKGVLAAQISNRLAGLQEVSSTTIVFADSPAWSRARISAAGRKMLQLDFPILNNRVR